MDYSLRELECFLAVAEELSFTRAAKRLNLAQPPLSRHIRQLEEKLGVRLFVREPRRVALTPAGRLFYEETRTIPRRLARAGDVAKRCAAGETARLRLGFVSAVMNDELVAVFRRFRERHPEIGVTLHDASPHDQLDAIAAGRLDGGFIGIVPPQQPTGIRFVPWRTEPLILLVPSGHPFSGRESIELQETAGESFVVVSPDAAPAFANLLRDHFTAAGIHPRVILESPRAQAVALMVAAGSGVAILPATLAELLGTSAHGIPLAKLPPITHVFACPENRASAAVESFLSLMIDG